MYGKLHNGDTFEHDGRVFRVFIVFDEDSGPPWREGEGHGPVRDWRHGHEKKAGEKELAYNRGSRRFYNVAEAQRIALRDHWGVSKETEATMAQGLGRAPTRREIAARAVEIDFDYLRGWCNDSWYYVGVVVEPMPEDGDDVMTRAPETPSDYSFALWGIESNAGDYLAEVAHELAAQIPVGVFQDSIG